MISQTAIRFVVVLLALTVAASVSTQNFVRVKRVIDGDTLQLESGEPVWLIGVNTPETKQPKKQVEYFGEKAAPLPNACGGGRTYVFGVVGPLIAVTLYLLCIF